MRTHFPLEPPPGFRGLHPYEPVESYRRHLPHWRQEGATYFVTIRLADSLPREKVEELKRLRREWQRDLEAREAEKPLSEDEKKSAWEKLARMTFEKAEHWLDRGMGSCTLRDRRARDEMRDGLEFFDGKRYELGAWVIMPNHAHLVVRPVAGFSLESILQSRKRNTARRINRLDGTSGSLWQEESFDRIIRDSAHLWRCVLYIGKNPRLANLQDAEFTRWIRPDWEDQGWGFVDPA